MSEIPQLLQDKVVVLSGVGPGLGRSFGEEAAKMGADLVLVSRTERRLEKMAETVRSFGRRALVVPTDINDEDARQRLVEASLAEFGKVDCLINNAFGIPPMDPITTPMGIPTTNPTVASVVACHASVART